MQSEKDALIERYAGDAFKNRNNNDLTIGVWRQHFVEFADKIAALSAAKPQPAQSVAEKALPQAASDFMHLFIQDGQLTVQGLEDTDLIPAYEKLSSALSAQVQDAEEINEEMSLVVALDFADNPRPYHTLQAPADTNGELYRALRTIAAAYRSAQVQDMAGWQPIETAPKDGTPVILWTVWVGDEISPDPFSEVQIGYWDHGNDLPASHDFSRRPEWVVQRIGVPTHWMPLPAAPAKQEGGK